MGTDYVAQNPTDPTPFIYSAYGIGFLVIAGYAVWLFLEYRRLQRDLEIMRREMASTTQVT